MYAIGTYIKAVHPNYVDGIVLAYCPEEDSYTIYAADMDRKIKRNWLEAHIKEGFLSIPEGRYEIWGDNECTCGAKHTSFPSIHLTYCNIGG